MRVSWEGVLALVRMRLTALRRMESCWWGSRGVGRMGGGALGAVGTATCANSKRPPRQRFDSCCTTLLLHYAACLLLFVMYVYNVCMDTAQHKGNRFIP